MTRRSFAIIPALLAVGAVSLWGQAPAPTTPRASAPIDLTGYWVSIVTEDWRWRMVTPAKGDYASIPLTAEAKRVADTWDPAKDEASGEQCRSYGAPGLMRIPGRLHITWQDDNTLKVEADAGTQTRLLHFGRSAPDAQPSWQGSSQAEWQFAGPAPAAGAAPAPSNGGSLKVVTTRLRPGYLRKNGVPYSADAVLTEYWDLDHEQNGEQWIVVTSIVHDPKYLQLDWITSLNFRKEADGAKWDPTPCSAKW